MSHEKENSTTADASSTGASGAVRSESTSTEEPKKRRRGCRGCLLTLVLLLILAALALGGSWYGIRHFSQKNLAEQLDSLRSSDVPTTPSDMAARYQVEPGRINTTGEWENAIKSLSSSSYQSAAEVFPFVGNGPEPIPPPGEWAQLEAVNKFIGDYQDTIVNLQLAAAGRALLPTDFANQTRLPDHVVDSLWRGFQLLHLNCYVQSHKRQPKAIASSLVALLNYSNCLVLHPAHQQERLEYDLAAFDLLAKFLYRVELDEETLTQIQSVVQDRDYWAAIQRAWDHQRAIRLLMYTDLETFKNSGLSEEMRTAERWEAFWKNIDLNLIYSPFAADDAEQFLVLMYRIEKNFAGNYFEAAETVKKLEAEISEQTPSGLDNFRYPTARFMVPKASPIIELSGQAEAWRQLLLAAVAADRFRIASGGRVPENLAALIPEYLPQIPLDEYTSQKIKYLRKSDSTIFYNCGPNRRDDQTRRDDQVVRLLLQRWIPGGDDTLGID